MNQQSWGVGFAAGLIAGLVAGSVLAGIGGWFYAEHAAREARAGWNLVSVLVAGNDMKAGDMVTYDLIAQRSVPEQFVTDSVIKPNDANFIVGHRVMVPFRAGDLLTWKGFASGNDASACSLIEHAPDEEAAAAALLEQTRKRWAEIRARH
ncbi:MAG: hypothetical protein JST54_29250 [Deltaproteobacteria bacterium]|nr:hypothetical protein [Deltaproteobacteria bacterium]